MCFGYELEVDVEAGLFYFLGYYFCFYWEFVDYFRASFAPVKEKFLNWSKPYLLFAITATGVPIDIWAELDDILATNPFYWT